MKMNLKKLICYILCSTILQPLFAQTMPYKQGENNGITDVLGVRIAHITKISGHGSLQPGTGPVRTGATVILPNEDIWNKRVPAATFTLNGNGELTGTHWIEESGYLEVPIVLTDTLDVGRASDGVIDWMIEHYPKIGDPDDVPIPVVGECDDQFLNDIQGRHITANDIKATLNQASTGQFERGSVGAGTGMILFGFKGGIGSASRILKASEGGYTVGVLVNANNGSQPRRDLIINGVAVGQAFKNQLLPLFPLQTIKKQNKKIPDGSIVIVVATDAPLESRQLHEIAKRAILGLGRTGLTSNISSGDFVIAFSTKNEISRNEHQKKNITIDVDDAHLNPLFEATAEATQAAIYDALFSAKTMIGADGVTIYGLPVEQVNRMLSKYTKYQ